MGYKDNVIRFQEKEPWDTKITFPGASSGIVTEGAALRVTVMAINVDSA